MHGAAEMAEPSWSEGYVVDLRYLDGFYHELTPRWMELVGLINGVAVVDADKPFNYVELGCGNGYSTALLAAANPQGRFTGVDFNPTHIHSGTRLAADAGLENIQFLEMSFAETLSANLPKLDFIGLHGVISWINAENRAHIVSFIRQHLNPSGLLYVSYNSLPGQAQVAPLQRLIYDHARAGIGQREEKITASLAFAKKLSDAGAEFFRADPIAKHRLERTVGQDVHYVAHEFFNADWHSFYQADVADEYAQAKLTYVGSAEFIRNFPQLFLKPELAALCAEIREPTMAEMVKDFAANTGFRRDVYSRGAPAVEPAERDRLMRSLRFALIRPRANCIFTRQTSSGNLTFKEEVHTPLLDALANGPKSFGEILALSPKTDPRLMRESLLAMVAIGNIFPALGEAGEAERRSSAYRFNEAVVTERQIGRGMSALASSVLGSGVSLNPIDQVFLRAHMTGKDILSHAMESLSGRLRMAAAQSVAAESASKAEKADKLAAAGGDKVEKADKTDGKAEKAPPTEAELKENIEKRAQAFQETHLGLLRQLGVLP
jgi:SAM-dependent methyltransferase